jgi:hypothetical protein
LCVIVPLTAPIGKWAKDAETACHQIAVRSAG